MEFAAEHLVDLGGPDREVKRANDVFDAPDAFVQHVPLYPPRPETVFGNNRGEMALEETREQPDAWKCARGAIISATNRHVL